MIANEKKRAGRKKDEIYGEFARALCSDYTGMLSNYRSARRTPEDEANSYNMYDARIDEDTRPGRLSMIQANILKLMLGKSDFFEHRHLIRMLMHHSGECEKTIRAHLERLCLLGYLHRCCYKIGLRGHRRKVQTEQGTYETGLIRKAYKVTEIPTPRPPDIPVDEWVYVDGQQLPHFHQNQLPFDAVSKKYGTLIVDPATEVRKPEPRSRGWVSAKTEGFSPATPVSKTREILPPYTVVKTKIHSSSSSEENPLSLSRKGFKILDDLRVEGASETRVTPSTRFSPPAVVNTSAISRSANKSSPTPMTRAAFNAAHRSAHPAISLNDFLANYSTTLPEALEALHGAGRTGTVKWVETLMANPLIAITQSMLGYRHWDHRELRRYHKRLTRGSLKPWEVLLLWSAKRAGVASDFVQETINILDRRDFREVMEGRYTPISWDERLRTIRNLLSEAIVMPMMQAVNGVLAHDPLHPCDSADQDFRTVAQRAAVWINLPNTSSAFFSKSDAFEWVDRTMKSHPAFWAGLAPLLLRVKDMPPSVTEKVAAHLASYPREAVEEWVADIRAATPLVAGGLTRSLIEDLDGRRDATPSELYRPVFAAIRDFLPEGDYRLPNRFDLFNIPGEPDFLEGYGED